MHKYGLMRKHGFVGKYDHMFTSSNFVGTSCTTKSTTRHMGYEAQVSSYELMHETMETNPTSITLKEVGVRSTMDISHWIPHTVQRCHMAIVLAQGYRHFHFTHA
jgi:hypothetical protein